MNNLHIFCINYIYHIFHNDLLVLLQIISENIQKFIELYKVEVENKKKPLIEIDEIITPQKKDNLKEISDLYISLVKVQLEAIKSTFLEFKASLCEQYICFFEGISIENLIYIQDLIKFLKSQNKKFEVTKDINKTIHDTGLTLSKKKKIK